MRNLELAVLIAGGTSSRMGQDKCLIEWDGKALWRRQLDTLSELAPAALAVAASKRPEWIPDEVQWLCDAAQNAGPFGGVLAALETGTTGLTAVLAVDLPLITANYFRRLLDSCTDQVGIVPSALRNFEPLAAIYPARAIDCARSWLSSGRCDLQGWIAELIRQKLLADFPISTVDQPLFLNLNHPEDLALPN